MGRGEKGREAKGSILLNKKDKLFQKTTVSLNWDLSFSSVVLSVYFNSNYCYVSFTLSISGKESYTQEEEFQDVTVCF